MAACKGIQMINPLDASRKFMSKSTTIHFVRHGAVHNPQNIYYGRLPNFHLSAEGLRQAGVAANMLERYKLAAIFSSPMERALETAEVISKQLGLALQTGDLLNEVYSPFDGQPISVLEERDWDVYTGTQAPFEQPLDILNRTLKFTQAIRKEYPGEQVVAVSHGDVIAFMVLWARQLPIAPQQKQGLYQTCLTYASISSFTFETSSETEIPRFESA
jgi:broad specificity phosphatase PhoE